MVGHDYFRNGAHADGVAAQDAVHAVLGRCLERWTLHANIHTMHQPDALFGCNLVGQGNQLRVVGLVHVGEARSGGEVLAAKRMLGEQVDVVGDDHDVADEELGIHASGGVAHEERLDAQLVHHAYGERHFLHRVALVVVEAALHGHDILAAKLSEDELAGMSLDGADGEVGDFAIGELVGVSYFGS